MSTEFENKPKIDKKTIIIIILGLIILIGGSYLVIGQIQSKAYNNGVSDGQIMFYNQLLIQLNQNGEIILPIQVNNQTISVRLVPIQ